MAKAQHIPNEMAEEIAGAREEVIETVQLLGALERVSSGDSEPALTRDDLNAILSHIRLRLNGALAQLPIS